jgi:hypothetical protein
LDDVDAWEETCADEQQEGSVSMHRQLGPQSDGRGIGQSFFER